MSDAHASRRKLYMHSAHETIGVSAGLAALQACDLSGFAVTADTPRRLRVYLVSGSPAHDLDESLEALEAYLTKHDGMHCSRALGEARHGLQGRENLARAGCLVLLVRGIEIVGAQTSGRGLPDRLEMDPPVCRGRHTGRDANGTTEIRIVETARDHPILAGVEPFVSPGHLDELPPAAADATVLLSGTCSEHTEPVAWTRQPAGSRVFRTSLGHPDDFRRESFLRLLANAVRWTSNTPR